MSSGSVRTTNTARVVTNILDPITRFHALKVISHAEISKILAENLWSSFGVTTVLLREVISASSMLNPPTLSRHQLEMTNNAILAFKHLASCPSTVKYFMECKLIVLYSQFDLYLCISQTIPPANVPYCVSDATKILFKSNSNNIAGIIQFLVPFLRSTNGYTRLRKSVWLILRTVSRVC